MGSPFGSSAYAGLDRLHEIAFDGSVRAPKGASGASVSVRSTGSTTSSRRTCRSDNDGRGGGRADFQWWFSQQIRANVAAEVAEPSPTLPREIGTMTSVRASLEARW